MAAVVVACGFAGCLFPSIGGLAGDGGADANVGDAPVDGPISVDAPISLDAAPRCNPSSVFGQIAPISGSVNTSAPEESARLSSDELAIVFARRVSTTDAGVANDDLFIAWRASSSSPFGNVQPLTALNSPVGEYDPFLMPDGLTIYFSSNRPAGTTEQIYVATRPTTADAFGAPQVLSSLDVATLTAEPFFLPDQKTIFFADISTGRPYTATLQQGTTFSAPVAVQGAPTSGVWLPVVSGDGLTMLLGKWGTSDDIVVTKRATIADPFGAVSPVAELNTTSNDDPTWLSADGCVVLFQSNRLGSNDIFMAIRGP